MDKLRWGVLGAGGIADRRTLPGMMKAGNAVLAAVMEVDKRSARRLAAKYGAWRAYDSAEELVRDPQVDAVYIASPVALHASQARMAADQGKHILLEKPLALTAQEGQAVADYCRARGVQVAAGFMMRFGSYVRAMRQAVAQGRIGQLVSGDAMFSCWYPEIPGSWRQVKSQAGGGALMDLGVHVIDLIQYVAGSRVRQVAAMHDTMTFGYEVEDASTVLLRLTNGALCTVRANFNLPDQAAKWRLEFFGTRGRLLGDRVIGQEDGGSVDALFLEDAGGYDARQAAKQEAESAHLTVELGDLYTREIESFGRSILEGAPLEAPAEDAVWAQRVAEAAYRSNDEKRIIDL